ncbi:hypothetical protein F5B20DRAFT_63694 [Whalleya microplaca]|nr:hypothetical protein F5B20DRAFT_63694 [Whalleya microplaca]
MADPENFEDDLFDDLYDDNEGAVAPAQASAPAHAAPAPAPAPSKPQPSFEPAGQPEVDQTPMDTAPAAEENGYGDDYPEDAYDDDDDVDFNLGNGQGFSGSAPPQQEVSTPTYNSSARGPSAKEDGICALVPWVSNQTGRALGKSRNFFGWL